MSRNRIKHIDIVAQLKYWLCSLYISLVFCLKLVFTFWKTGAGSVHPDKPVECDANSSLGIHSYVKVQRIKFHYVEAGDKRKPLLLLLHGFLDCWIGWKHQIPVLKEHFRVISIDLKGYGDSEKPQWRSDYQIRTITRELQGLVKSFGVKRCTLIGHDVGALVGWYLTALYPELISKFVAISCPHPNVYWDQLSASNHHILNSRFVHMSQLPALAEYQVQLNNLSVIDNLYTHFSKRGESEILKTYKYVFSRKEDIVGPINYLRTLPLVRLDPGIVVTPTLLIIGNKSPAVSAESIVRSTTFLKDFQMKMVDGAGHFPHQEYFDTVNDYLITFLVGSFSDNENEKSDSLRGGIIGSLVSNTFKYGNSIVDNVKKTTNSVAWKTQLLKS